MKPTVFALPLLLALACAAAVADPLVVKQGGEVRRSEVRDAVDGHRAAKRDEVRRGEAIAGRRLTAAELAELREQIRQQWVPRQEIVVSSETQPAERLVPLPLVNNNGVPVTPLAQRP